MFSKRQKINIHFLSLILIKLAFSCLNHFIGTMGRYTKLFIQNLYSPDQNEKYDAYTCEVIDLDQPVKWIINNE